MLFNMKIIQLSTVIIITSLINSISALGICRDVITNCNYCGSTNHYPVPAYYLQNCMRSCGVCTHLNVALNKPTIQSSTYSDPGHYESLSRSSNAVDGDTDGNWYNEHCTHTRKDKSSWWCVDLQQIYNILYIKLFNRDDNKDRLRGFEIKTSSSGTCNRVGFSSATSCYKDTTSTVQDVYTIDRCNQPSPTSISARTVYVSVSYEVLTLCEVQIFSAQCNNGYFSTSTSTCQPCNTCLNDRCNPDTGACSNGCKGGYYGDDCEDQCSDGCLNNQCNEKDGTCTCKDGYYGDTCTSLCSPNCKDGKCSTTSSSSSRECTDGCIDGYKDSYCQSSCPGNCKSCQQYRSSCTACNQGWFGTNCFSSCSSNCVGGCDKIGGRCVECKPDTVGLYCNLTCGTECQPITDQTTVTCDRNGTCTNCIIGRYGDTCNSECTGCDGGCNRGNGKCTNCIVGRYGDRCDKNCSTGCDAGCGIHVGRCTKCVVGRYGYYCDKNCSTGCDGGCVRIYGECTSCIEGRYGKECYKNCSTGCDGGCDQSTGRCTNCITGRYGDRCDKTCTTGCDGGCSIHVGKCTNCVVGRYGYYCNKNCSTGCDGGCDQSTGRCTNCLKGKTGDMCDSNCNTNCTVCNQDNTNSCTECKDGTWGTSCNKLCNPNCKSVVGTTIGKCYQMTGICINGCLPGKIGSICTADCAAGLYGDNCVRQCGNCGNKRPCDIITGSCGLVGCADGFQGPTCHERVHVSTSAAFSHMVYVVIGVVIGVLCGILGTVAVFLSHHFYKKRRQSTPRSPNEEIIPDYMYFPSHLNPTTSTTDDTLTTGYQNIPTNTRNVDYVNQSFNTEDNTGDTYDTLDHTSNDLKAPNTYASIDSNKHK